MSSVQNKRGNYCMSHENLFQNGNIFEKSRECLFGIEAHFNLELGVDLTVYHIPLNNLLIIC